MMCDITIGAKGWFPQGWFWQMLSCTEISTKKSFPAVLTLAEESYDFDIPGPKNQTRAHSPKPPFYKTALLFPLGMKHHAPNALLVVYIVTLAKVEDARQNCHTHTNNYVKFILRRLQNCSRMT